MHNKQQGFALIAIIVTIAIIAALLAYYYKPDNNAPNIKQTQKSAEDQVRANSAAEMQNKIDIENQINSIGQ